MSKTTDKIIELRNEREVISNCCASRLVENSYSYDPEFGASGKCSYCNEGCSVDKEDMPGFEGTWNQLNQL
tara:strand:+ start:391 stop:603 length:213 start_codon:yes stop_codon:yes gene_type:complete